MKKLIFVQIVPEIVQIQPIDRKIVYYYTQFKRE